MKGKRLVAKQLNREGADSAAILYRGVHTREDYAALMSSVMTDVLSGRITARDANRIVRTVKMPE